MEEQALGSSQANGQYRPPHKQNNKQQKPSFKTSHFKKIQVH